MQMHISSFSVATQTYMYQDWKEAYEHGCFDFVLIVTGLLSHNTVYLHLCQCTGIKEHTYVTNRCCGEKILIFFAIIMLPFNGN